MAYSIAKIIRGIARHWLSKSFPARWDREENALVFESKGDAELIRRRLAGRTKVIERDSHHRFDRERAR